MRRFAHFILGVVLLAWAPAAMAQAPNESAIREVITRQLETMRRGDGVAAFAIASPAIQGMFGDDAERFMGMVERSFPQVFRSRSHRFLKLENTDGKLMQGVLIESDSGTAVARYEMVVIDGIWRINGCFLDKADGA